MHHPDHDGDSDWLELFPMLETRLDLESVTLVSFGSIGTHPRSRCSLDSRIFSRTFTRCCKNFSLVLGCRCLGDGSCFDEGVTVYGQFHVKWHLEANKKFQTKVFITMLSCRQYLGLPEAENRLQIFQFLFPLAHFEVNAILWYFSA